MIGKFSVLSYGLMVYKRKFLIFVHESLKIKFTGYSDLKVVNNRNFNYFSALQLIQFDENAPDRNFQSFLNANYRFLIIETYLQKFCWTVQYVSFTMIHLQHLNFLTSFSFQNTNSLVQLLSQGFLSVMQLYYRILHFS